VKCDIPYRPNAKAPKLASRAALSSQIEVAPSVQMSSMRNSQGSGARLVGRLRVGARAYMHKGRAQECGCAFTEIGTLRCAGHSISPAAPCNAFKQPIAFGPLLLGREEGPQMATF